MGTVNGVTESDIIECLSTISVTEQSDSVIYIIYILFFSFLSTVGYYKILNIVPYAI